MSDTTKATSVTLRSNGTRQMVVRISEDGAELLSDEGSGDNGYLWDADTPDDITEALRDQIAAYLAGHSPELPPLSGPICAKYISGHYSMDDIDALAGHKMLYA